MFQNISNLNKFASTNKMNMLWNLKKGGLLLPPPPKIQASSNKEKNLASISNKLISGKRLTPEEMRYLQEYAPDMHRQAVVADAERSAYESAAKSCRTKEDVQQLHSRSMTGIMASEKADPVGVQIKSAAITDAYISFAKSSAYSKLPTETQINEELSENSINKKDGNDSIRNTDATNIAKERQDIMQDNTQDMMDTEQIMQFTLRNYHAQAEKQANADTTWKSEPATIQTAEEESALLSKAQSHAQSGKAYLQSKGITIDNPLENHVSFSSLVNTPSSTSSSKDAPAGPVASATVGRAHAAYVTARSTVTSAPAPDAVKSVLRTKA